MSVLPIPVSRYLVPATPLAPPPDAQIVDLSLVSGLPVSLRLAADTALVLTLATGLATEWRAVDPLTTVASSGDETAPRDAAAEPGEAVSLGRLSVALQRGGRTIGLAGLVGGPQRLVEPAGDGPARRYDLWILSWDIRAGTIRGPGDFGSTLRLAWRVADQGAARYSALPPSPAVIQRTPPAPSPAPDTGGGGGGGLGIRILGLADRVLLKKGRLLR